MINYLIYASLTSWNEPPRSRHQITNELKQKGTVYFVERSKIGAPKIEIKKVEDNVYVLTPTYPIHFRIRYRTPILNEFYHNWLLNKLKKLSIKFDLVITFDFTSYLINNFSPNVIYYCGDDYIGNSDYKLFIIDWYHKKIEKNLATGTKLCIVTSEFLLEKISLYNFNTHLVPLGAPTVINHEVRYKESSNKEPVLGLVAYINRRMPLALLDDLLRRFKIVFIGPTDASIQKRYLSNENAEFIGLKEGVELYTALEKVDVTIAPYDEEKINKGVTPNKLWFYLALGKPCVVTDIPNIKNWFFEDKEVYKTKNKYFSDTCLQSFKEDDEASFYKRIETSKRNSWAHRVENILELFYESKLVK
jgi:hypothetical protein